MKVVILISVFLCKITFLKRYLVEIDHESVNGYGRDYAGLVSGDEEPFTGVPSGFVSTNGHLMGDVPEKVITGDEQPQPRLEQQQQHSKCECLPGKETCKLNKIDVMMCLF